MTSSAVPIKTPANSESITPDWLTHVLRRNGVIRHAQVDSSNATRMGEAGFIGELARIELSYSFMSAGETGAPKSLIAKFSHPDPGQRTVFHGIGFYEKEIRFYQDLASRTPIPTPYCFHAEIDLGSGESVILLEDLAEWVTASVSQGCTLAQAKLVVRQLAEFHAYWWESEELQAASYIPPIDQLLRIYHLMFQQRWPALSQRLTSTDPILKLSKEIRKVGDWLYRSSGTVFTPLSRSPFTLVHMDIHLDNLVFQSKETGPPLVVFDWQTFGLGRGVTDLTYFLLSAVPIEIRRRAEGSLLESYHGHLTELGVTDYSLDECIADYRRAAVWNLLIFTVFATAAATDELDPVRRIYIDAVLPRLSAFFADHGRDVFIEA